MTAYSRYSTHLHFLRMNKSLACTVLGALHSQNRRNFTSSTRFCSVQIPSTVPNGSPLDQPDPSFVSLNHNIYLSTSFDPYFNLTLEDWLFRHAPTDSPLLIIYRDSPCVVIGRNQNPWTEVNFSALHESGIPFIRRRSGGGTVYHDLGNSNFSIHLPRTSFDRHATGGIILKAVRSLGIDARLNERNDLCVGERKVSGSAYKIVNRRAYHHGTMLISSRLDTLGDLLRPKRMNILTKGVESVRSPVSNLVQHSPHITHQAFTDAVIEAFKTTYGITTNIRTVHQADAASVKYIQNGVTELQSWPWKFGQTPEFTRIMKKTFSCGSVVANIRCRHGIIEGVELKVEGTEKPLSNVEMVLQSISEKFKGQRYGFVEVNKDSVPRKDPLMKDIQEWLAETE